MTTKKNFQKILLPAVLLLIAVGIGVAVWLAVSGSSGGRPAAIEETLSSDYPLRVDFVDVGQGDGILIRSGEDVIVIDGGEAESASAFVAALNQAGVRSISCYVATHPHSDHIGAAKAVFAFFDVKRMLTTSFSEFNAPTVSAYEELMTAAASEPGCEVSFISAGESLTFGELRLDFFAPVRESTNHNDMSIVFKMTYRDVSFLFTGDAEAESEALMLDAGFDLRADVLKVGHHGSSSSTTEGFLAAVNPAAAVISCGKNNVYGHPNRDVLRLLEDADVPVYRTDQMGTVTFFSDGRDLFVRRPA